MARILLLFLVAAAPPLMAAGSGYCETGCDLALASYYVSFFNESGIYLNLTFISGLFGQDNKDVLPYNLGTVTNQDVIITGSRLNIAFPCDCNPQGYLARTFSYRTQKADTYSTIASNVYANLTSSAWLAAVNTYSPNQIPTGVDINVTVNCSCGDASVSKDYGLFETYPLRTGESLASVASAFNLSTQQSLLQSYNPGVNFSSGKGIVFIPAKDPSGSYRPLQSSTAGMSGGAIAGISVAVLVVLLVLASCLYAGVYRKNKAKRASLLPSTLEDEQTLYGHGHADALDKTSGPLGGSGSSPAVFTVDRSVEFSYEELAKATNDFSMSNKIGQGGFGAVYYAELRGEKAAIKKMDMQATREFLAELKVLTHVHHLNLVRLIGYCTEGSLFLVYEYIDNGNLSQHLHGSGREPLSWSSRVQIALDSARGLEYIHEHTVPVYIHRDIKSANILIDNNFHAKVADFGLAKLTQAINTATRVVGTFGYMPPEYAQYGEVSSKVDVFAFGVVLYELISAKEAILRSGDSAESRGLVALFEDTLSQSDPREELRRLIDSRLGEDYPFDSVFKMAQLAKACTQENPQLRPSMRTIVVALMTLSSSTDEWDVRSFYENQALANLMSGRSYRLPVCLPVTLYLCRSRPAKAGQATVESKSTLDLKTKRVLGEGHEVNGPYYLEVHYVARIATILFVYLHR